MNYSKDPHMIRIEAIHDRLDGYEDDLKEIKGDIKSMRTMLETDVLQLKLEQQKCNSHWSWLSRLAGFSGISAAIAGLVNQAINHK